jgi:hypothetical protein
MSVSQRRRGVLQASATAILVALGVLGAISTSAGIQGSGIRQFAAIGPITSVGSGSVVVGGVEYSTSGAPISIDGQPGGQSQLQQGDVVSLSGVFAPGRHLGVQTATAVTFSANVRGVVAGVDAPSSTFYVLGQTVHVTAGTVFDSSIQPAGLEGLQNGAVLEVSGFADSSGNLVATRVGTAGNSDVARVVGAVSNLNPAERTFSINSLVVSYDSAVVEGALAEGAQVAVQGPEPAGDGALDAASVDVVATGAAPAGTVARIEGLITEFASASYFEVDGQPVTVDANTLLNLHVPLGLDVAVKVTGVLDDTGVLVARKVQSKSSE